MIKPQNLVMYICMDCGAKFIARQGSVRRYCVGCMAKRIAREKD